MMTTSPRTPDADAGAPAARHPQGADIPAPAAARKGWWRRNASALVAAVVFAGALAWMTSATEYSEYWDYRPSQPVRVAPGETLELGGATFTVVDVDRLYPGGLPRGTAALRVTVDVAAAPGGGLPTGCTVRLSEEGGTPPDRIWQDATFDAVDFVAVEGAVAGCPADPAGDSFTLAVPFVVPADVDGTLTLRVEVPASFPRFAALEIGPLP